MNYYNWSKEYEQTAAALNEVVMRLKRRRTGLSESEKKELTDKISFYRRCRNEALDIAQHLMARHKGAA